MSKVDCILNAGVHAVRPDRFFKVTFYLGGNVTRPLPPLGHSKAA
jgi:hypothetical protein